MRCKGGRLATGGHVALIGQLGRKNVHNDGSTERGDFKILETLIGLYQGEDSPVGLPVKAFSYAMPTERDDG